VTGKRGRIPQHLLDYLKENGGYWKLEEQAICEGLALEEAMDL
jgi:hypothetical protein